MVAFRFVLACSIAPSLLIDGVVVEKNKQLGMDDYYEAEKQDPFTAQCPGDVNKENPTGDHKKKNEAEFAKKSFGDVAAPDNVVELLRLFLFDGANKPTTIPELFADKTSKGLEVGPANECANWSNWVPIKYKTDPDYVCGDCGYDMADTSGKEIIKDIVNFAADVYPKGNVKATDIPKIWCHNPYPLMNFTKLTPPEKEILRKSWRGTGGYYNVLKCKTSKYSVIGFAAEKSGTCYPFHVHKSYELYWTIGGNATWKAFEASKPPATFPHYTINKHAGYELHKHNPKVTHEMVTDTVQTTQVYFWSMSGNDNLTVNEYDADHNNVIFGLDKDGDGKVSDAEKKLSLTDSCYNDKTYGHIGDKTK